LARGPATSGQSKPVRAARFWSLAARSSAGEGEGDAGQHAWIVGLGSALGGLDLFPAMMTAGRIVAEDVRVAALHLVADAVEHLGQGEVPGFGRHLGVEDDLQRKVAEFVLEVVEVAALAIASATS
jgi:hypothetical protein